MNFLKNRFLSIIGFNILFIASCISINTVPQVDNYRIETNDWRGEQYFFFKSKLSSGQTELSLRKQFGVSEEEKLSNFDKKLFDEYDIVFNVRIDIHTDRNKYIDLTNTIINREDAKTVNGIPETFVKIEVFGPNGENCLSRKSLFSGKTKSLLLDIKDNIKQRDYINVSSDQ